MPVDRTPEAERTERMARWIYERDAELVAVRVGWDDENPVMKDDYREIATEVLRIVECHLT